MNTTARLTIRVPFCFYECRFCPQGAISGQHPDTKHAYMAALLKELAAGAEDCAGQRVDSVHITGGIIAAADGHDLDALLTLVRSAYPLTEDCQIVLNAYPGTVNVPTVRGAMKHHVTAIDCEVFTADGRDRLRAGLSGDSEAMGLTHYVYLNTGFNGAATTLLCGLPGQTEISFRKSLGMTVSCAPRYISVLPCPGTEGNAAMAAHAEKYLTENGYTRYAEGRYARGAAPLRCYLPEEDNVDYPGFGLGACSRIDGIRCRNTQVLSEYIAHSDDPAVIVRVEG